MKLRLYLECESNPSSYLASNHEHIPDKVSQSFIKTFGKQQQQFCSSW